MIPVEKLDFWIKSNLNVLFEGKHGIGKTTIVKDTFERHGLKYAYLSAATMDPWVDFIGIPKEITDENGNRYLELIRPKDFAEDNYDIIFIDELNRAPAKLRNAILELIQFKSINGKKYNRLKAIWGAINPDTEENIYDVERLDPAQKDRFHIHFNVDYAPDVNYFTGKFGAEMAKASIEWWNALSEDAKERCSPRRLDYALDIYRIGGDLRDVLHQSTNVGKLITSIENGVPLDALKHHYGKADWEKCGLFLANENNYNDAIKWILEDEQRILDLIPLISCERIVNLITTTPNVATSVCKKYYDSENIRRSCDSIITLNKDSNLVETVKNAVPAIQSPNTGKNPIDISEQYGWRGKKYDKRLEDALNNFYNEKIHEQSDENKMNAIDTFMQYLGTGLSEPVGIFCVRHTWLISTALKDKFPFEKCFGIMNFIFEQLGTDMRNNPELKMINNFIISDLKSEDKIWVPNVEI
jgi:hypothetical protein